MKHPNFNIEFHKAKIEGELPLFSILIPTWNNLSFLKLTLRSIKEHSKHHHQIILHVNQGCDGTLDFAKQSGLDFTYSQENVGVCAALNAAAKLAVTDYLLYFNDDMYACPEWDTALYEEVKNLTTTDFYLSCTTIEPKQTPNRCPLAPFDFGRTPETFREQELLSAVATLEKNDWQGSTWPPALVHKSVWNKIGGYSEEFYPGYYSDPDFSMKLWKAGVRLFKGVSKSKVYHFMAASTSKVRSVSLNQGYNLYLRKWNQLPSTLYRYYLRSGEPFDGPLRGPEWSLGYCVSRIRGGLKRLFLW